MKLRGRKSRVDAIGCITKAGVLALQTKPLVNPRVLVKHSPFGSVHLNFKRRDLFLNLIDHLTFPGIKLLL